MFPLPVIAFSGQLDVGGLAEGDATIAGFGMQIGACDVVGAGILAYPV